MDKYKNIIVDNVGFKLSLLVYLSTFSRAHTRETRYYQIRNLPRTVCDNFSTW